MCTCSGPRRIALVIAAVTALAIGIVLFVVLWNQRDSSLASLTDGPIESLSIRFYKDILRADLAPIAITDGALIRRLFQEPLTRARTFDARWAWIPIGEMTVKKDGMTYEVFLFHPLGCLYFGGKQHVVELPELRTYLHRALGSTREALDWI